jgi:MFS transporter, PAT family, beta-lactamase induction signal transducer AmpG
MENKTTAGWRSSLGAYSDRRVLMVLALGFASGLPYLLTVTTLSAWLATAGIRRAAIGVFAIAGTPYALKFLWAPLIDRLPPPLPLGRRRGWGITIQFALMAAILALATCDPKRNLMTMGALTLLVAFLAASQDIVIDAWRIEILPIDLQGPGAGAYTIAYRTAMLVSGAVALIIAEHSGWFAAYSTMAVLLSVGMLVFLFGPEPNPSFRPAQHSQNRESLLRWFSREVLGPFTDFMRRPLWPVILMFSIGYKVGEGMGVMMANPLYISLGFSLSEIAAMSKLVGFFAVIVGALIGGVVTVRFGILRSLLICGILQAVGNLFFVLQAMEGHRIGYLALCVTAENLTSAMAGVALVAYLSSLCSAEFTATQYALLSSFTVVGRTLVASSSGVLAETLGWVPFWLLTTVVTIPALLLLIWIARREARDAKQSAQPLPLAASTRS